MKRFLTVFAVALLVAGCASSVKLDEVPVEDKAGQNVGPVPVIAGGAQGSPVPIGAGGQRSQTAVAPMPASGCCALSGPGTFSIASCTT